MAMGQPEVGAESIGQCGRRGKGWQCPASIGEQEPLPGQSTPTFPGLPQVPRVTWGTVQTCTTAPDILVFLHATSPRHLKT